MHNFNLHSYICFYIFKPGRCGVDVFFLIYIIVKYPKSVTKNLDFLIVALLSTFLLIYNLGSTPFWDDEASVAWFSKNLNGGCQLFAYDGNNAFFYRNGSLIDHNFIYNNPPLDIYFAKISSLLFGETNFGFRFGFVLLGVFSIYVFYKIIKKTIDNRRWQFFSFTCFILSVNFLLFSRNCRYFSIELFCGLILYYLILLFFESETKKNKFILSFLFCIFSILIFLGHFSQGFIMVVSILFSSILLKKTSARLLITDHFILTFFSFFFFLFSSFYILYNKSWVRNDMIDTDMYILKIFKLTIWLINDLNRYFLFPIYLTFFLILIFLKKNLKMKILSTSFMNFFVFVIIFLGLSILLSPQPTSKTGSFEMRYIYSIFPFISILFAYFPAMFFEKIHRIKLLSSFFLIIFLSISIFFYIPILSPVRLTLIGYLYQLNSDYKTVSSELIPYLKTHLIDKKTVRVFPEFYHTTLNYYFPDKMVSVAQLDSISGKRLKKMIAKYGLHNSIIGKKTPDMVILIGNQIKEFENSGIDIKQYSKIDTLNVYGGDGFDISRPEMAWHSFFTIQNFNINKDAVYIFQK